MPGSPAPVRLSIIACSRTSWSLASLLFRPCSQEHLAHVIMQTNCKLKGYVPSVQWPREPPQLRTRLCATPSFGTVISNTAIACFVDSEHGRATPVFSGGWRVCVILYYYPATWGASPCCQTPSEGHSGIHFNVRVRDSMERSGWYAEGLSEEHQQNVQVVAGCTPVNTGGLLVGGGRVGAGRGQAGPPTGGFCDQAGIGSAWTTGVSVRGELGTRTKAQRDDRTGWGRTGGGD